MSAGLTIEAAAERAEVSSRQWDRLEAGTLNTTLRTLVSVGRALNVDPGDLLLPTTPSPTPSGAGVNGPEKQAGPTRPKPR